jgi:hypothetical protein
MTTVGRWSPNKVRARVLDGTWVSPEELGGMVLLTPTSIAYTGTSASIGANGSVEFTAITNLELRGVFSADYDNYMVVIWWSASGITTVRNRFMSGTTPASGTDYVIQTLAASSTTITGARYTSETAGVFGRGNSTQRNGVIANIYGPYLAQPTAQRTVGVDSTSSAQLQDDAGTHSLSTSYDGLNIFPFSNNMTGLVSVFGLVGA